MIHETHRSPPFASISRHRALPCGCGGRRGCALPIWCRLGDARTLFSCWNPPRLVLVSSPLPRAKYEPNARPFRALHESAALSQGFERTFRTVDARRRSFRTRAFHISSPLPRALRAPRTTPAPNKRSSLTHKVRPHSGVSSRASTNRRCEMWSIWSPFNPLKLVRITLTPLRAP